MALYTDLKYTQLLSTHFDKFVRKNDYLFNVRCPLCGDSETKKTKMRGYIYRDKQRLAYKCHNCTQAIWLGELILKVAPTLYKDYLFETFGDTPRLKRRIKEPNVFEGPSTSIRFGKMEQAIFQNAEKLTHLPETHYCIRYVKERMIPQEFWSKLYFTENYAEFLKEIYPEHGKALLPEARLVIPFYDPYKALLAVSGRAFEDNAVRYITVRTNQDDDKLIYGLDRIDQNKLVQIVEGPLDSLFLGNTIASCDSNLILTAQRLSAAQIVLVYDNEKRSGEICRQMERAIKLGHKVVVWPSWLLPKDINEMVFGGYSPSDIQDIIYKNTFSGLTALAHLTYWKKCIQSTKLATQRMGSGT